MIGSAGLVEALQRQRNTPSHTPEMQDHTPELFEHRCAYQVAKCMATLAEEASTAHNPANHYTDPLSLTRHAGLHPSPGLGHCSHSGL